MDIDCEFEMAGEWATCRHCGHRRKGAAHRNCPAKLGLPIPPPGLAQPGTPCGQPCGKPEPALPGLLDLSANLARYAAEWLANGCRTADAEQYSARLAICETCPSGFYRPSDRRCAHPECGCYLLKKAAGLAAAGQSDCPAGHWPVIG